MIYIALGANLPHPRFGPAVQTLRHALAVLEAAEGLNVEAVSRFYRSAPVPPSGQPDYVNAVARLRSSLDPAALLAHLHVVEADFGRVRHQRNEARVLDLDLLLYGDTVLKGQDGGPVIPHPRMHLRHFVLMPLAELAPHLIHPVLGVDIQGLLGHLPAGEGRCEPLE